MKKLVICMAFFSLGANSAEHYDASSFSMDQCIVVEIDKPISVVTQKNKNFCVRIVNTTRSSRLKYFSVNNGGYYPQIDYAVARNLSYQLLPSKEEKVRNSVAYANPNSDILLDISSSPRVVQSNPTYTIPHIIQFLLRYDGATPYLMINTDVLLKDKPPSMKSQNAIVYSSEYFQEFSSPSSSCSEDNKSPDAAPDNANLNKNIAIAELIKNELDTGADPHGAGAVFKYTWFYFQVRGNAPWDFKQIDRAYADFGNYHYGAVGKALDIPDQVLLRGAGWAQWRAGTSDKDFGFFLGGSPYGDDPKDQAWIKKGINYYNQVIAKKPLQERLNGGEDKKDDCNETHNDSTGSGGSGGGGGLDFSDAAPGRFFLPDGIPLCTNIYLCTNTKIIDL